MKKAITTKTDAVFWRKNGRNYRLVDGQGNPVRDLPKLDRAIFDSLKEEKTIPYKEDENGIQIWRPGKFALENITAPIWKEDKERPSREMHTGMAPTEETVKEAEKHRDYLVSRYEKNQRKEKKKQFEQTFEQFFGEQTKDRVSIFWTPGEHPELSQWKEYLDADNYICFMNNEVETGEDESPWDSEWGVILRRDIVKKFQESEGKVLYLKAPEEVMTKIRDAKFIGAMKRKLGLEYIKVFVA